MAHPMKKAHLVKKTQVVKMRVLFFSAAMG
jgi:hypothetical protein